MANKSILCKNKKTLIPLDEKEDKIFHYPDNFIHDIVPCDRGVYIILKENDYLDSTKNNLQTLYKKIVNDKKIDKTHPKIKIDRKKEK